MMIIADGPDFGQPPCAGGCANIASEKNDMVLFHQNENHGTRF
jgi:hypothetical protein